MKRAEIAALPVGTVLLSCSPSGYDRENVVLTDNEPCEISIRRITTHSGRVTRSVQAFRVSLVLAQGRTPYWGQNVRELTAKQASNGDWVHGNGWSQLAKNHYEGLIEPRYLSLVLAPNVGEWAKIEADEKAAAAADVNLKARRKAAMVKLAGEMDSNQLRSHSGSFEIGIKVDDMLTASDLIEHYRLSGGARVTITFGLIDEAAIERIEKG